MRQGSIGCVGTSIFLFYVANSGVDHYRSLQKEIITSNPHVAEVMYARDIVEKTNREPAWRKKHLESGDYPEAVEYRNALKIYTEKTNPANNRAFADVLRHQASESHYSFLGAVGLLFGFFGLASVFAREDTYQEDDYF